MNLHYIQIDLWNTKYSTVNTGIRVGHGHIYLVTSIRCLVDLPVTGDPPNKLHIVSFEQGFSHTLKVGLGVSWMRWPLSWILNLFSEFIFLISECKSGKTVLLGFCSKAVVYVILLFFIL